MKYFRISCLVAKPLIVLILSSQFCGFVESPTKAHEQKKEIVMVVFTNHTKTSTVEIRADSTIVVADCDPRTGAIVNIDQIKLNNFSSENLYGLAALPRDHDNEDSWRIAVIYEGGDTAASENISPESEIKFEKFLSSVVKNGVR